MRKSEHIPARVLKLAERSASWKTDFDPSARIVGEALAEKRWERVFSSRVLRESTWEEARKKEYPTRVRVVSTPEEVERILERRWMRVSVLEVKRLRRRSEEERGSFVDAMIVVFDCNC